MPVWFHCQRKDHQVIFTGPFETGLEADSVDSAHTGTDTTLLPVDWDYTTHVLTPNIQGNEIQATPTDVGIIFNLNGYIGTTFALTSVAKGTPTNSAIVSDTITGTFGISNLVSGAQLVNYYANFVLP